MMSEQITDVDMLKECKMMSIPRQWEKEILWLISEVEQLRARLPGPGRDSVSQLLSNYNDRIKELRRENGELKHRLAELGVHG